MEIPFWGSLEFRKKEKPKVINSEDDDFGNVVRIQTAKGVDVLVHPRQEDNGFYRLQELLMNVSSIKNFYENFISISSLVILSFSGIQKYDKMLQASDNLYKDGNGKHITFEDLDNVLNIGKENEDTSSRQLYWIAKYTIWINLIKRINRSSNKNEIISQLELDLKRILDGEFYIDQAKTISKGKLTFFQKAQQKL